MFRRMNEAPRSDRTRRAFAATVALAANLLAAGVPVVHAMAHEIAEASHPAEAVGSRATLSHEHDEVHPASLHDEQLIKRHSVDLAFVVPAATTEITAFVAPATIQHRPARRLASRAPPTSDLPRGPPLA